MALARLKRPQVSSGNREYSRFPGLFNKPPCNLAAAAPGLDSGACGSPGMSAVSTGRFSSAAGWFNEGIMKLHKIVMFGLHGSVSIRIKQSTFSFRVPANVLICIHFWKSLFEQNPSTGYSSSVPALRVSEPGHL